MLTKCRKSADGKNVIIKRSEVSGATANITNLSVEHVLEKTWLGAFFDGKSQWVVFQSDNFRLSIFNANKGKGEFSSIMLHQITLCSLR